MIVERPSFFTEDVEERFIVEWARSPDDIVGVALRAFVGTPQADETGLALNVKDYFESNAELQAKCYTHVEATGGIASQLPSKETFAYEILKFARNVKNNIKASAADKEFALRCYRLYAEIANMIDKPAGTTNVQINNRNIVNKVMVIPPEETIEQWTAKTIPQQRELIHVAVTSAAELRARKAAN